MNKRQAKKFLRNPRRVSGILESEMDPREREARRKARGRWSPWKTRIMKFNFTVDPADVRGVHAEHVFYGDGLLESMVQAEDERIFKELVGLSRSSE